MTEPELLLLDAGANFDAFVEVGPRLIDEMGTEIGGVESEKVLENAQFIGRNDEDDLVESGGDGLFEGIARTCAAPDGQQFFGHATRYRFPSRTLTSDGYDGDAYIAPALCIFLVCLHSFPANRYIRPYLYCTVFRRMCSRASKRQRDRHYRF